MSLWNYFWKNIFRMRYGMRLSYASKPQSSSSSFWVFEWSSVSCFSCFFFFFGKVPFSFVSFQIFLFFVKCVGFFLFHQKGQKKKQKGKRKECDGFKSLFPQCFRLLEGKETRTYNKMQCHNFHPRQNQNEILIVKDSKFCTCNLRER